MSRRDEFVEHLLDLLHDLGPVQARKMFGGWGLFRDGVMFALVADERLYIKVDDKSQATFAEAGSEPFTYGGKDKPVTMSYWEAPDGSLESAEELLPWARLGTEAARRAKSGKKPKRKPG